MGGRGWERVNGGGGEVMRVTGGGGRRTKDGEWRMEGWGDGRWEMGEAAWWCGELRIAQRNVRKCMHFSSCDWVFIWHSWSNLADSSSTEPSSSSFSANESGGDDDDDAAVAAIATAAAPLSSPSPFSSESRSFELPALPVEASWFDPPSRSAFASCFFLSCRVDGSWYSAGSGRGVS